MTARVSTTHDGVLVTLVMEPARERTMRVWSRAAALGRDAPESLLVRRAMPAMVFAYAAPQPRSCLTVAACLSRSSLEDVLAGRASLTNVKSGMNVSRTRVCLGKEAARLVCRGDLDPVDAFWMTRFSAPLRALPFESQPVAIETMLHDVAWAHVASLVRL